MLLRAQIQQYLKILCSWHCAKSVSKPQCLKIEVDGMDAGSHYEQKFQMAWETVLFLSG